MNSTDIEKKITSIQHLFEHTNWIIGGSAAKVLQDQLESANDIDIIQHSGDRVLFNTSYEKRMWSYFYHDLSLDCHFSNPRNLNDYAQCFHKIIEALEYIDNTHRCKHKEWNIVTPTGAGLVNWLHHFLPYGYQSEKTVSPKGQDKNMLQDILGFEKFNTIQWNVEHDQIANKGEPNALL